jgi:hypothetical protein
MDETLATGGLPAVVIQPAADLVARKAAATLAVRGQAREPAAA